MTKRESIKALCTFLLAPLAGLLKKKSVRSQPRMDGIEMFPEFMANFEPQVDLDSPQGKQMARVWYGAIWAASDYVCQNTEKLGFDFDAIGQLERDLTKGMSVSELFAC